ncbi:MAG: hypothetical protein KAG94_05175 [Clostridiales bacterium]|nr:hypothetical protein [Clostridiales bacterium]
MKHIGKGTYWRIFFSISFVIYIINLLSVLLTNNILFLTSSSGYNYLSLVFTGIFVYLFYSSLKKGALTIRYIITMFVILVFLPFVVAILMGSVTL